MDTPKVLVYVDIKGGRGRAQGCNFSSCQGQQIENLKRESIMSLFSAELQFTETLKLYLECTWSMLIGQFLQSSSGKSS